MSKSTKTKPEVKLPTWPAPSDASATESTEGFPPAEKTEHLATIPDEESETEEVLTKHIRCTETGIIVEGEMPITKWILGFEFFQKLGSKTQWWRGDMLIYGEAHYGESYAQAVDIHGKSQSRLQTYVTVCLKFPIERRRPELSFDHHAECASLDPREADALLLRAIRERWTKMDVREETAKINDRNGIPANRRGRKPGSTAAKVAASGKEPQVPAEESPLIWNGHPLRVMVMPDATRVILQGNEPLPTEEADRAAHHFKHAHGPALAIWLEEHNFRKDPVDASEPSNSATSQPQSSGASLVQPEAAPKLPPLLMWKGKPVTIYKAAVMVGDEPIPESEFNEAVRSLGFPSRNDLVEYLETWAMHLAPAAPAPAQHAPEPSNVATEPKSTPEPQAGSAAIILSNLWPFISEDYYPDMATPDFKAAMEAAKAIVLRTPEQATNGAPPAAPAETPIEAAERHLRSFNLISVAVDWKAVGASNLLKKKWLGSIENGKVNGGILNRADEIIDIIQGTPITPRK